MVDELLNPETNLIISYDLCMIPETHHNEDHVFVLPMMGITVSTVPPW